uniref:Uncharacterized protein n=1 Tax=Pseudo-nitzschia delicatissima TaxID=44447 RepID=A0A7S0UHQ1_9STRA|mmetsp:Transcript_4060/g.8429  ORF Transcript_4060/g.8429 Transcript_4060/m.8429 type:complete len:134 (+) Transcript_4060:97-498(+)
MNTIFSFTTFLLLLVFITQTHARTICVELPMSPSSLACVQMTHEEGTTCIINDKVVGQEDCSIAATKGKKSPKRIVKKMAQFVAGLPVAALGVAKHLVVNVGMGIDFAKTTTTEATRLQIREFQTSMIRYSIE